MTKPATLPTAPNAPKMANALLLCFSSSPNVVDTIDTAVGVFIAAPIPCKARKTMTMIEFVLAAIGIAINPTIRKPKTKTGFGENMSERRPEISMKEPKVSVYAEIVHWRLEEEKFRSLPS